MFADILANYLNTRYVLNQKQSDGFLVFFISNPWVLHDIDHSINIALFIPASFIVHFDVMRSQHSGSRVLL